MEELKTKYDTRKSFCGKAKVLNEGGRITLLSYGLDVAYIQDGEATINGSYSQTTTRHITEFLKQNGFMDCEVEKMIKRVGGKDEC